LVLDYNLFSGGKDLSNRKAQLQRVVAAKKKVDAARRNAEKVCRSAWDTYISDQKQVKDSKVAVEVNIVLQRDYEIQFELVSRPLLDLLDAYVSYYRSKDALINAEADEDINHALLLATVGELIASFQCQNTEEPE
jgi:adhesin transport system outer membrane protein